MYVCLSACLSVVWCLSVCLSMHVSVSTYLSVHPVVCLSACLPVCAFVSVHYYLSACHFVCTCLFVCLSITQMSILYFFFCLFLFWCHGPRIQYLSWIISSCPRSHTLNPLCRHIRSKRPLETNCDVMSGSSRSRVSIDRTLVRFCLLSQICFESSTAQAYFQVN